MSFLPTYYKDSKVMQQLQAANETVMQEIDEKLDNVLDQYILGSADTTLARWEKEFDIPTDESKTIEHRRAVLIAKFRGAGTTTVKMLKNTALAYANGEIDVIDDATHSTVTIKFVSVVGVPPNIDDFKNTISDVVPAHLLIQYEYKYNTHAVLGQYTHAYLSMFTHEELRSMDISNVDYARLEGRTISDMNGVI